jgi:hypothetical protein
MHMHARAHTHTHTHTHRQQLKLNNELMSLPFLSSCCGHLTQKVTTTLSITCKITSKQWQILNSSIQCHPCMCVQKLPHHLFIYHTYWSGNSTLVWRRKEFPANKSFSDICFRQWVMCIHSFNQHSHLQFRYWFTMDKEDNQILINNLSQNFYVNLY